MGAGLLFCFFLFCFLSAGGLPKNSNDDFAAVNAVQPCKCMTNSQIHASRKIIVGGQYTEISL